MAISEVTWSSVLRSNSFKITFTASFSKSVISFWSVECNFTGYKGRLPIMEIIPFNNDLIEKLDIDKDFSDIRSLGYRTLQDDGILKFLEGKISLDEVVRLT